MGAPAWHPLAQAALAEQHVRCVYTWGGQGGKRGERETAGNSVDVA